MDLPVAIGDCKEIKQHATCKAPNLFAQMTNKETQLTLLTTDTSAYSALLLYFTIFCVETVFSNLAATSMFPQCNSRKEAHTQSRDCKDCPKCAAPLLGGVHLSND